MSGTKRFSVTIGNFRTKKQALEFLDWYEGGGEQQFHDHIEIVGLNPNDGCYINVLKTYEINGNNIYAEVE